MKINLELEKVIARINDSNSKKVCIQLPDGLKPKAKEIEEAIRNECNCEVFIWAGSCFGACDIPDGLEKMGIDLLVQWGHSEFIKWQK